MTHSRHDSAGIWDPRGLVDAADTDGALAAGPPPPPPPSSEPGTDPEPAQPEPAQPEPEQPALNPTPNPPDPVEASSGSGRPAPPQTPFDGNRTLSLEQRLRRRRVLPLVGIAIVVALMFIGPAGSRLVGSADGRSAGTSDGSAADDAGTPPAFTPSTTDQSAAPPAVPLPATDPQAAALAELDRIRTYDLDRFQPRGQHVAQLASKSVGIVDPLQVAENGSHVFYASDILAEHLRLRQEHEAGSSVVLLLSTDYGRRQRHDGQPLWVTVAVADFTSADDVTGWCADRFPYLSAALLENQCVARTLEPPHD
ncbi:hypothetical protein ACN27F_17650 [Solwaraspora sp. WMMB335]|uniref:hypothetical protein n=1 Tax=Solwaraspora sp. WMMB335 TaxID=3404118 RepID=UPI003B962D26